MQTRFLRPARIAAVSAGAIFSLLALAGCSHDETPPTVINSTPPVATAPVVTATTPGTTTIATTPGTKINTNAGPGASTGTDTALAQQVKTAIMENNQMTGARVEVVATSGAVTLNGSVQNQTQKALAQKTASQVPGVGSNIKNKLIIVTTGGAKPKPIVITKTKTIVVHDKSTQPAPTSDTGNADTSQPPAPPSAPEPPTQPAPGSNP